MIGLLTDSFLKVTKIYMGVHNWQICHKFQYAL